MTGPAASMAELTFRLESGIVLRATRCPPHGYVNASAPSMKSNFAFTRALNQPRLWSLMLLLLLGSGAASADVTTQRDAFARARQAQSRGDYVQARKLAANLGDYPLRPYLEYEDLRHRLDTASESQVLAFVRQHEGSYLGEHLRTAWLRMLARKSRWSSYLDAYRPQQDRDLQCQQLTARLTREPASAVLPDVQVLWQASGARSSACAGLFARLYASATLDDAALWNRVADAMDNGETKLAQEVAGHFSTARYRLLFAQWQRAVSTPLALLRAAEIADSSEGRRIAVHALARLARQDVDGARQAWRSVSARLNFTAAEQGRAARAIALAAAGSKHVARIALLDAVPAEAVDVDVQRYQLREGIAAEAWPELVRWTALAPLIPDETLRWRYWRGRALDATGRHQEAEQLLREVASERDYYGFLAADRLGLDYQFREVPIAATRAELDALAARPGLIRAREFERLALPQQAAREWNFELKLLAPRELEVAAVLAGQWGRPDRAIFVLGMASAYDDLALRFPILYADLARKHAARRELDPARVLAIIRSESAFNPSARSPVGALGLMQLMPQTARETARSAGVRLDKPSALLDPGTNIALGTTYLRQMLARYNGNFAMAAAAYNAGPGRVRQWQGSQCVPSERWIESIPFTETRGYVRRALFYAAIYQRRLERPIMKLTTVMPPIPARDARATEPCPS